MWVNERGCLWRGKRDANGSHIKKEEGRREDSISCKAESSRRERNEKNEMLERWDADEKDFSLFTLGWDSRCFFAFYLFLRPSHQQNEQSDTFLMLPAACFLTEDRSCTLCVWVSQGCTVKRTHREWVFLFSTPFSNQKIKPLKEHAARGKKERERKERREQSEFGTRGRQRKKRRTFKANFILNWDQERETSNEGRKERERERER